MSCGLVQILEDSRVSSGPLLSPPLGRNENNLAWLLMKPMYKCVFYIRGRCALTWGSGALGTRTRVRSGRTSDIQIREPGPPCSSAPRGGHGVSSSYCQSAGVRKGTSAECGPAQPGLQPLCYGAPFSRFPMPCLHDFVSWAWDAGQRAALGVQGSCGTVMAQAADARAGGTGRWGEQLPASESGRTPCCEAGAGPGGRAAGNFTLGFPRSVSGHCLLMLVALAHAKPARGPQGRASIDCVTPSMPTYSPAKRFPRRDPALPA